jgi:hypothetical protein
MKDSPILDLQRLPLSPGALAAPASDWLTRWWPELVAAALLVASIILMREVPLGHDAVWQMWIARQLAHGARLYSDVLEVNPPLWFWMAVPLHYLAEAVGSSPRDALKCAIFGSLGLSLALIALLRPAPRVRAGMYLGLLLAATVVALPDFAQREQYTLLATAPWVALIAARAEQKRVPVALAALVGIFAASGLALKIHFAIVPLALEVWLAIALRRVWIWRLEVVVLSIGAAAYAAAVVLFAPDYLRVMVPMVLLSYGEFGTAPVFDVLLQFSIPLSILAGVGLYTSGGIRTRQGGAALVASLAFLAAFIAQQKGWRYHSLPALGMLFVCVGAEASHLRWSLRQHRPAAVAFACVMLVSIFETVHTGQQPNERATAVKQALADIPRGEPVLVLALNPSSMPVIEDLGLVWPSRLMSSWFLQAIVLEMQRGTLSPAREALGDTMRAQLLADMLCHPPKRILVDSDHVQIQGHSFGYLDFYRMEPAMARFLDRYRPGPTFGRYLTFDLADKAALARPARCRPVF